MRHLTPKEEELLEKLKNKELSKEEKEKITEELKKIDIEVNNGLTWLT